MSQVTHHTNTHPGSTRRTPAGRRGERTITWRTVSGLLLVPLTVAGVLLWGLWNPGDRLETVTAAVVNLDEPAEMDGQPVPLGRMLAGELIGEPDAGADDEEATGGEGTTTPSGSSSSSASPPEESASGAAGESGDEERQNFNWVLTDEEDAASGLDDGRYATAVTIPENFSRTATSMSTDPERAERATIDIETSERGRLIDSALSNIVTQTAMGVLNEQLGSQFVGGVFVGMTELGSGIGDAADGAEELAEGGSQLADGAEELADGTGQLAQGAGELASGADGLASGTNELAGGAGALASGADGLADGAGAAAGGAEELAQGARDSADGAEALAEGAADLAEGVEGLAEGARGAADGSALLADGVEEYTGGVGDVVSQIEGVNDRAQEYLNQLYADIQNDVIEISDPDAKQAALDEIASRAEQLAEAGGELAAAREAGDELASGARESANGSAELASGLEEFSGGLRTYAVQTGEYAEGAGQLAAGVGDVASGVSELSGGAAELAGASSQLAGGAGALAQGAGALSQGTSELAAQTPELAEGTSELAEGARGAAAGAGELSSGLDEAAAGIPDYSEATRDRLAETAVQPVEARGAGDALFNAAGVPLFAGIALWAGGLAAFLVLTPLWRRTREAALGIGTITLRSIAPALGLGALQGAIAGIVLPIVLGYDFSQGLAFAGLGLAAGIAFALLNQGLAALFGGIGRFVSLVLLVVGFAVGIVSTAPGPLLAFGDATPIGAAFSGFGAVATGASGAGTAVFLLILWAFAGAALTGFAVIRHRRTTRPL